VTGGAGAGVFEGFGVAEAHPDPDLAAGEGAEVVETRWRLSLEADGTFRSSTRVVPLPDHDGDGADSIEMSEGSWTLDADHNLSLHAADGTMRRTLWKGDVIALDGLVFTRLGQMTKP
jgi:hypothetical protein